jgi:hypothetical protein
VVTAATFIAVLQVVIILVMSIIACLVAYMAFLVCLDPSARTMAQTGSRYQQHHDEDVDDENIFTSGAGAVPVDGEEERPAAVASSSSASDITMRRPSGA